MPTPNALDQTPDLLPTPVLSEAFGTNVGEKILEEASFLAEPTPSPSSRCNVSHTEQKIRLAAGTALVAAALCAPLSRGWRIGLAAFGASQLLTGAMSYCPLWHALGINTRRAEER